MNENFNLGLLGYPVSGSLSSIMHNYVLSKNNLPGKYSLIEVKDDIFLADTINDLTSQEKYIGLNITIPYKIKALDLCSDLTLEAQLTGAVNTIKYQNGILSGHNTDIYGFRQSLNQLSNIDDLENAFIIGSGGSARAVVYALTSLNLKNVIILTRNRITGESLITMANNLKVIRPQLKTTYKLILLDQLPEFIDLASSLDNSLIINASPLGNHGNELPKWLDQTFASLKNKVKYYDLNYSKNRENLSSIVLANSFNIEGIDGTSMLAYQAKLAFFYWLGLDYDYELFYKPLIDFKNSNQL